MAETCGTSWISRVGDDSYINGLKVTFKEDYTNTIVVNVVQPWGGTRDMYLTRGVRLAKFNPDGSGDYFAAIWGDVWDTAVEIKICKFTAPVDPCAGVSCPPKCVGDDLYRQSCVGGVCSPDLLLEENAASCGYIPPVEEDDRFSPWIGTITSEPHKDWVGEDEITFKIPVSNNSSEKTYNYVKLFDASGIEITQAPLYWWTYKSISPGDTEIITITSKDNFKWSIEDVQGQTVTFKLFSSFSRSDLQQAYLKHYAVPVYEEEPIVVPPKGEILDVSLSAGMIYNVGDTIYCDIKVINRGDAGKIKVQFGTGFLKNGEIYFIDSKALQVTLEHNQSHILKGKWVNVTEEAFNRQEGVGWLYSPTDVDFYCLVGHEDKWDDDYALDLTLGKPEEEEVPYVSPIGEEEEVPYVSPIGEEDEVPVEPPVKPMEDMLLYVIVFVVVFALVSKRR